MERIRERTLRIMIVNPAFVAAPFMALATFWLGPPRALAQEGPSYTVEHRIGDSVEVRAYAPFLAAEVGVWGYRDEALDAGLSILTDYLEGANAQGRFLGMPTDIRQQEWPNSRAIYDPDDPNGYETFWRIAVQIPDASDIDTLPAPDAPDIRLEQFQAATLLVISFVGGTVDDTVDARIDEVKGIAAAEGLDVLSGFGFAVFFYPDHTNPAIPAAEQRTEIGFHIVTDRH